MQVTGMDVLIAEQAYWPTPSVALERVQTPSTVPSYAGSPQVLTLRLQQPVWTGGRLKAQFNKALANQQIETARLAEIQQLVAFKTLQDWTDLVNAQRQQLVLGQSEKTQTLLMQKMMRRVEQGLSSQSEANHSKLRLMQVEQDIVNAKQRETVAWIRLKQWVPEAQKNEQHLLAPDHNMSNAPIALIGSETVNPSPIHWELLSKERSPALKRLEHVMALQTAELEEKRAALQPEIYVRAEHQRGHYAYANSPASNRIFVGLTASTGAGFSLAHQLTALQFKRNSTIEEMDAAQRTLIETVHTDFFNAIARQSKAEALRLNLESSQEQQAAWERQFTNGRKTWMDVMTAARESTQAELAVIENDMALHQSLWRLHIQAYGVLRWIAP
ncbi:MAG: hypothetical protein RL650_2342 [Pseudomonadota bacterium]|jgi:adhesin transport system outer membrane protein